MLSNGGEGKQAQKQMHTGDYITSLPEVKLIHSQFIHTGKSDMYSITSD